VLITDALCYSTTDIFTAGFQDHSIGPILGTAGNTGAGGANVWPYELMQELSPSIFQPLPNQASMRLAMRRSLRVGRNAGTPVEDLGVLPDQVHRMTRRDLLEANVDLIEAASVLLQGRPVRKLGVTLAADHVSVECQGMDRLDLYFEDRPIASVDVENGKARFDQTMFGKIEIRGFQDGVLVARVLERNER